MARLIPERDIEPIHQAFATWRDKCLVEDGSLFSDTSLWTAAHVEEVRRAFVDHPDEGSDSFLTKLEGQMREASTPAQQLMAEMQWALLLFPSNITPERKRQQIQTIWSLSGSPLSTATPLLSDTVLIGIGSGGQGFNQFRPKELAYLIAIVVDLKSRTPQQRRRVLTDYDAFAAWIDGVPRDGDRQYRHMLRYFCFPDRVERTSTNADRKTILAGFGEADTALTKQWTDRQLDDALLTLRKKLEAANPGTIVDFYLTPFVEQWRPDLRASMEAVMAGYLEAKRSQRFNGQAPMYRRIQGIAELLRKVAPVGERPTLEVSASAGIGNWVDVPWIGIADKRETESTQRGVYCVYLFREDMSGVYLTFNQGVTELTREFGWRAAEPKLRKVVADLRSAFPELAQQGFSLSDDIDLRAHGDLGQMYEVSTIAHKFYEAGKLPSDEQLEADLDAVLATYVRYIDSKAGAVGERSAWIFQANLDYFDLHGALASLGELTWVVRQYRGRIHKGDTVFLWQSGPEAGIVAVGTVSGEPAEMEQLPGEARFNVDGDRFGGRQLRARVRVDRKLEEPIRRAVLQGHPVLRQLTILTGPQGSNFLVTKEQEAALLALLKSAPKPPAAIRKDLRAVVETFAAALRESRVSFGTNHDDIVRAFVASLAAKRLAILTGLSGSGKTQLALRFGEWLGESQVTVVPVRPDWTGAEALFGYEDALQPIAGGRRAWHVPLPLKFMIDAAADPYRPYLLVLDEMNLAHVERYFADVLSGMESEEDCLPNLREEGGVWRIDPSGPDRRPVPRNLFVVGTVNVDETTYMFSPKVLDRANTFEFRVRTGDLLDESVRPRPVAPGDPALVGGFLSIAADDAWHIAYPAPQADVFRQHMRTLHKLLSVTGFEFGHRVFYESVRFAAMLASAGDTDVLHAVDRQVMQKVLPRLHGSRRRLEATLCSLALYCNSGEYDPTRGLNESIAGYNALDPAALMPRLPISFDKTRRMIEVLRANQFVSFTE